MQRIHWRCASLDLVHSNHNFHPAEAFQINVANSEMGTRKRVVTIMNLGQKKLLFRFDWPERTGTEHETCHECPARQTLTVKLPLWRELTYYYAFD